MRLFLLSLNDRNPPENYKLQHQPLKIDNYLTIKKIKSKTRSSKSSNSIKSSITPCKHNDSHSPTRTKDDSEKEKKIIITDLKEIKTKLDFKKINKKVETIEE